MKERNEYIDKNSKTIEILKDSDFLRLFRYFILKFWKEYKKENKNIANLVNDFKRDDFLDYFRNKNDYNLFKQFYTFFDDFLNKAVFFETLKRFNIDETKLNIFLNIWEYLQEIWDKEKQYSRFYYDVPEKYKRKIEDVIKIHWNHCWISRYCYVKWIFCIIFRT